LNWRRDVTASLVDCFVELLNSNNILYCHWKGNFSLAQVLAGEKDFELLVDRKCLSQTVAILLNLGYKPAVTRGLLKTPGISHYYGCDSQTGQLIHIHLYTTIFTGETFFESHLLPFEPMLLENVTYTGKVRIPSKSAELIVYVLRTFIRYGSLPDLIYLSQKSEAIAAEFCWLQTGTDLSETLCLLKKFCPVISESLFLECLALLNSPSSLLRKVVVALQVRQHLQVYARSSNLGRVLAYAQLLGKRGERYFRGNKRDKTLDTGGALIAFIGPEATGKSTLVSECAHWLETTFIVRTIHAGKPPASWLTIPLKQVFETSFTFSTEALAPVANDSPRK
jgi:hypothetical protein